jgi:hypothetical protein
VVGSVIRYDVGSLPAAMQRSGVLHSRAYPLNVPGIADADQVWPPSVVTFEMYRTPPRPAGPGTFCRESQSNGVAQDNSNAASPVPPGRGSVVQLWPPSVVVNMI